MNDTVRRLASVSLAVVIVMSMSVGFIGFGAQPVHAQESKSATGGIDAGGTVRSVAITGDYLVAGHSDNVISVYDISDPANPQHVQDVTTGLTYIFGSDSRPDTPGEIIVFGNSGMEKYAIDGSGATLVEATSEYIGHASYLSGDGDVIGFSYETGNTDVFTYDANFNQTFSQADMITGGYIRESDAYGGRAIASTGDDSSPEVVLLDVSDPTSVALLDTVADGGYGADIINSTHAFVGGESVSGYPPTVYSYESDTLGVESQGPDNQTYVISSATDGNRWYVDLGSQELVKNGEVQFTSTQISDSFDNMQAEAQDIGGGVWAHTYSSNYIQLFEVDYTNQTGGSAIEVNGAVVDQTGAPVSGGTVEYYAVQKANIDGVDTVSEARSWADELADATPSDFVEDPQFTGTDGLFTEADGKYAAVHLSRDIEDAPWIDGADLTPRATTSSGEKLSLTCWDATEASRGLLFTTSEYDKQLPGRSQEDCDLRVERLYGDDSVDSFTVTTNQTAGGGWGDPDSMNYAEVSLTSGYYKVTPVDEDGNSLGISTYVRHGDTYEIVQGFGRDLAKETGANTEKATDIANQMSNGGLTRETATVGDDGTWSGEVPSGTDLVVVQAYKYPDGTTVEDFGDIQNVDPSKLDGAVYQSTYPAMSAPTTGIDVQVVKLNPNPFGDISDLSEWMEQNELEFLNSSTVQEYIDERVSQYSDRDMEEMQESVDAAMAENAELRQEVRDLKREYIDDGMSPEDAEEQAKLSAISLLKGDVTIDDVQNVEEEDGTLDADILLTGDVSEDTLNVLASDSDGKLQRVDDEYLTLNKRPGRADIVEVRDYPIGTSPIAQFVVTGVDGDKQVRGDAVVNNPGVQTDVPALDFTNCNVLQPAKGETVKCTMEFEEASASVVDATLYGPSTTSATVDGGTVMFAPDKTGRHTISFTVKGADGNNYSQPVTLDVRENPYDEPASLRVIDGTLGTFALTNGKLVGGDADINANTVSVVANADTSKMPTEVHVFADSHLSKKPAKLDFQIADSQDVTVQKHIRVIVHSSVTDSDVPVYRNNKPVANGGQYGQVEPATRGSTIQSYTDERGNLNLRIQNSPDWIDEIRWKSDVLVQKYLG